MNDCAEILSGFPGSEADFKYDFAIDILLITENEKELETFIYKAVRKENFTGSFIKIPKYTISKYDKYPKNLQKLIVKKYTLIAENPGNSVSRFDYDRILRFLKGKIPRKQSKEIYEQYLLSCPPSSGGCSGWNAYWAYAYLYHHGGIIPESCFPYRASDRISCSEKCNDWEEKLLPITDYGSLRDPDRDYLKKMIVDFGPVVAEMTVYSDFHSYRGGIYKHLGEEPISDINHQVVIIGYDDNAQCWICKNSWGTNWGERGFFRIAYGDCQIEHYIVYANFSPVIPNADGPYYGKTGEAIKFDGGKSYSLLNPIINYTWDFGDGSYGYGKYVQHAYSNEGKFYVRLTIRDKKGNEGKYITKAYIDNSPPNLEIKRPKKRYVYLFNEERRTISIGTIIIGNITISASAEDKLSGLDKIDLYIDNHLVTTTGEQLEWNWQDANFGFHVLEIRAFDIVGNKASYKIKVFTWM